MKKTLRKSKESTRRKNIKANERTVRTPNMDVNGYKYRRKPIIAINNQKTVTM